jgi:hypothetical protein
MNVTAKTTDVPRTNSAPLSKPVESKSTSAQGSGTAKATTSATTTPQSREERIKDLESQIDKMKSTLESFKSLAAKQTQAPKPAQGQSLQSGNALSSLLPFSNLSFSSNQRQPSLFNPENAGGFQVDPFFLQSKPNPFGAGESLIVQVLPYGVEPSGGGE